MQKKACQPPASSATPKSERQTPPFARSKKMKKKACQALRNLITLPKPNQTNGETND
jgi:hypothetical protein